MLPTTMAVQAAIPKLLPLPFAATDHPSIAGRYQPGLARLIFHRNMFWL
jgi:hypothetical protein